MRKLFILTPIALGLALSACSTTGGENTMKTEQKLAEECRARGGILVPLTTTPTGRPEADNACQITGGASRVR